MNAQTLSLECIDTLPQTRKHFDDAGLEALTASIQECGLLEPIVVSPASAGRFLVVCGERRLRAARRAGLLEVSATVLPHPLDPLETARLQATENLQRTPLSPLEYTSAILSLLAPVLDVAPDAVPAVMTALRGKPTDEKVAAVAALFLALGAGDWKSFVSNRLPLLKMPSEVIEAVQNGELEYTKARKIAQVVDPQARQALLEETLEGDLSSAKIAAKVKAIRAPDSQALEPRNLSRDLESLGKKDLRKLSAEARLRLRTLLDQVQRLVDRAA